MDENTFAYSVLDKPTGITEESQLKVKDFKLSPSGEGGKELTLTIHESLHVSVGWPLGVVCCTCIACTFWP